MLAKRKKMQTLFYVPNKYKNKVSDRHTSMERLSEWQHNKDIVDKKIKEILATLRTSDILLPKKEMKSRKNKISFKKRMKIRHI